MALIQVSLPDEFGYVSLGVSVDVIPAAVARARLVIAEVNPAMPRSMGDSMLHVGQIDHLVPVDTPVIEYQHPATQEQVVERIARYIGGIIDDGSTLQVGLGRFSNEALKYLADRRTSASIPTSSPTPSFRCWKRASSRAGARRTSRARSSPASPWAHDGCTT